MTALLCFCHSTALAGPKISSVLINGVKALPGDPLSSTPIISVTVTSTNAVTGRISVDNTTTAVTFAFGGGNNYYGTLEVAAALADGSHSLTIEAFDAIGGGATFEVVPLFVQTNQELVVQGRPLNYPNPFDPGIPGGTTLISYILSKAANITLSVHDMSGTPVYRTNFSAGTNGGLAGYNAVTWNGRSDAGQVAGNGIYVYLIIADGRVAAKGKLMVLKK
jgi:hypothetical protein